VFIRHTMREDYYQKTEGLYSQSEGLKAAKRLVRALETLIRDGSVKLENPQILFGNKNVKFTKQEYFALAKKALDQSIEQARPKDRRRPKRENY
jgi:hypothetical protein